MRKSPSTSLGKIDIKLGMEECHACMTTDVSMPPRLSAIPAAPHHLMPMPVVVKGWERLII